MTHFSVLFIDIFFDHIFHRKTRGDPVKLATFKSGGQEKIGIVHTGDTLLFDLAAAASRSGSANPGLRFDAGIDRRRRRRARTGGKSVRQARQGREPVGQDRDGRDSRAGPGAAADAGRHVVSAAHPASPARAAQACRARQGRHGGAGADRGGAARRTAGGLSQAADLLHHQPFQRPRHQHHGEVAALQPGDGLRTRIRHHHQKQGRQHLRRQGQGSHLRLYDLQRLFRARCPAHRNGRAAGAGERQEF